MNYTLNSLFYLLVLLSFSWRDPGLAFSNTNAHSRGHPRPLREIRVYPTGPMVIPSLCVCVQCMWRALLTTSRDAGALPVSAAISAMIISSNSPALTQLNVWKKYIQKVGKGEYANIKIRVKLVCQVGCWIKNWRVKLWRFRVYSISPSEIRSPRITSFCD